MQVTQEQAVETPYALLILDNTTHHIDCQYYAEKPDLKMSRLGAMDIPTMKKNNIAGFALCTFSSPAWMTTSSRFIDSRAKYILTDYIRQKLNNNFSGRR